MASCKEEESVVGRSPFSLTVSALQRKAAKCMPSQKRGELAQGSTRNVSNRTMRPCHVTRLRGSRAAISRTIVLRRLDRRAAYT